MRSKHFSTCVFLDMEEPGPSALQVDELVSHAVQAAGNGSSTNGSSETPARPRKRPETWKRSVAKVKRARGEPYISPSTGKEVPARTTGPPCRCKRKCFQLFSAQEVEGVISDFNDIGDKQLQDAHLFGLMKPREIQRRRPRRSTGAKTRRASYLYYVSET